MKLARKIILLMVATFVCVLAVLGWIESRGLVLSAFSVHNNPLHPNQSNNPVAKKFASEK